LRRTAPREFGTSGGGTVCLTLAAMSGIWRAIRCCMAIDSTDADLARAMADALASLTTRPLFRLKLAVTASASPMGRGGNMCSKAGGG
jgi:hypothetical protein